MLGNYLIFTEISEHPLYLRDGDVIVFKLNNEKLKVLSAEEKAQLEKQHRTTCACFYFLGLTVTERTQQATMVIKKLH